MSRVLCLIPARGGSVGVPGKNIRQLGDKPLIAHVISTALESGLFDKVVVSTDDLKIQEIALAYGAEAPFLRPEALATSTAKTVDAMRHAIEWLEARGEGFDDIVLMQPTQPFTSVRALQEAYEEYLEQGRQGVVSLSEVDEHPILMRTLDGVHVKPLLDCGSTIRRQDMPAFYKVNGAIYINPRSDFEKVNLSLNDNPVGYVMHECVVDIDTEADFRYAQYLLTQL